MNGYGIGNILDKIDAIGEDAVKCIRFFFLPKACRNREVFDKKADLLAAMDCATGAA